MRRSPRSKTARLACTLVALAAVLVVPAAAQARAKAPTSPYGHKRITYRNATTYRWQVAEAFAQWNRAGTPFSFAPARRG
jgi:hypothetical protein